MALGLGGMEYMPTPKWTQGDQPSPKASLPQPEQTKC